MSITVREWIEKFNNGEFDSKDIKTQCVAGWIDWHCAEEELPGRLKAMGNIIKNIKDDYILDNFKVDFKNNCPVYSPLFDYFRFTPIKKGKEAIDSNIVNKLTFGVECGHPFGGDFMYEIFTGRSGYSVEFHCKNEQEVLKVITQLAKELQKWFLLLDIGCSVIKCAAPNKVFQLLAYTKKILTDNFLLEAKDTDILYINSVSPEKNNYEFTCWNTKPDGTGTSYTPGQAYSAIKDGGTVTLYALYNVDDFTLNFDANGGTGKLNSVTHKGNQSYALPVNTFTRIGYEFRGWSFDKYTDTISYKNGATYDNRLISATLYAQWKKTGTGFIQRPFLDSDMFYKAISILGNNGTVYNKNSVDSRMAHIDTANDPGYFSLLK